MAEASLGHLLAPPRPSAGPAEGAGPGLAFLKPDDSSVRVVRRLLGVAECRALITAVEGLDFSPPGNFEARDRVCERVHTVDPGMSGAVLARLRPFVPEVLVVDGARWRLSRFTHHWRYVRYFRGGHFAPHYDGSKLLPWQEMSMFTVQVYLNSRGVDFEGGNTRFYMDHVPERKGSHGIVDGQSMRSFPEAQSLPPTHAVRPVAGDALVFDHCGRSAFHDAEPVSEGCKYIMRGDLLYAALPEDRTLLSQPSAPPEQRSWCWTAAARYATRDFTGQVWTCQCAADRHGAGCCRGLFQDPAIDNLEQLAPSGADRSCGSRVCVLLSGKRASGKDHVASALQSALESQGLAVTRRAAGSINKRAYAAKAGVDPARLEADREFKEAHRIALVQHHQARNREDPDWCLEEVWAEAEEAGADVLLLPDFRSLSDLRWFERRCGTSTGLALLRIGASEAARRARGWQPDAAKDGLYSETDLDSFEGWDACFDNTADSSAGLVEEWVSRTAVPRVLAALGGGGALQRLRRTLREERHERLHARGGGVAGREY